MTYQRVLVKDHAKRAIKGKKPCRRALAFLLLYLLFSLLSMLPALIAGFVYLPGRAASGIPPVLWLWYGLTLLLHIASTALLFAGGCAYCLDLWRGRGADSRRFWAGFSLFSRTVSLGLRIALLTLLWSLPYVLLLLLVWLALMISAFPGLLFPFVVRSLDTLAALAQLAQPTPLKIALVVILAVLFLALYVNRVLGYSMAFFVLLDRPRSTPRQCLQESKALMKGRKWKLLVLALSFFGWYLLSQLLLLGVQQLWPFLLTFFPAASLPGAAFWCLRLMLIFYLILMAVGAVLLPLWLMNYMGVSLAGFYDFAQSDAHNRPAPPRSWQVYS